MSNLVLWGHHLEDYKEMFLLTPTEVEGRLLEFASGPSAFNAELHHQHKQCISCDPLFVLDKATLATKTSLLFEDMHEKTRQQQDKFDLSHYNGLEGLVEKRRQGMAIFFEDYVKGKEENRYVPIHEIQLPFANFSFDLALTSHYLFSHIEQLDLDFHCRIIKELARVAKEVRIFPLIDRYGKPSKFLGPVLLALQQDNYGAEVKSVHYHLQPQGNAMLRVWAQECAL